MFLFCHQLVYNDLEFFYRFLFNDFFLRFYISLVSLIYVKLSFITINWRLAKKIIKWVETNNSLYKWFKCSYIRLFMSLIAMFYLSLCKKSFRSWLSTSLIIKKEVYSLMFLTFSVYLSLLNKNRFLSSRTILHNLMKDDVYSKWKKNPLMIMENHLLCVIDLLL